MALSAFLKQNGHECFFIDLALEKDYSRAIENIKPDITAYSITTGKHIYYQQLNLKLKKKFKFISIFGGPHTTFFPEFIEAEGVDVICRGEGEHSLLEFVEALQSNKDYTSIKNLWIKSNGKIYRNEVRPLIEDLDSLPFIDREILNRYKHYQKQHRRVMLSGRGCPYRCSYCFNHSYNTLYNGKGKIVRKRSVGNVLQELKLISEKYNPKRFHFIDDTFILDRQWCLDFCTRYQKEIDKEFIVYTRVNMVTDEIIKKLKQAGCITILYAIESGNDYIRNTILERGITKEQIFNAVAIYKKYKLRTYAQNMVGIPDETMNMVFETVEFNIKCKPDYAWCSIFQPYPGTKLWNYCKEKGYLSSEEFDESYHRKSILRIPHRMQIENLHHLFSMTVSFPFFYPFIKIIIKLPLSIFYYIVWQLHRAYSYFFKVKWLDLSEIFIKENRWCAKDHSPKSG